MLFSKNFIELTVVDSTNNYALELVKTNLAHNGTAIFAHNQTKGKGQMGKKWISKEGENIIFSIVLDVSHEKWSNNFIISAFAAVTLHGFLKTLAGDQTTIKWPNDIYYNDKKAGGILIEIVNQRNEYNNEIKKIAIVGIGLNINTELFSDELPNAVSLKQITQKQYDVLELAKKLHENFDINYVNFNDSQRHDIMKEYNLNLYKSKQTIKLKKGNIAFDANIESVNEQGLLEVSNCMWSSFKVGEIEWVR